MKRFVAVIVVCFAFLPAAAFAQGFIDINAINVVPADKDQHTYTYTERIYGEIGGLASSYPKLPNAPGLDVSAGWVAPGLGLGFQIQSELVTYKYKTVGMSIAIPSPYFFNLTAFDSDVANRDLERKDLGVSIGAMYKLPIPNDRVWIRVFGGPTYFHLQHEFVNDIEFTQFAPSILRINQVTITDQEIKEVTGTAWGYHAGVDAAFYFAKHVGVGGVIRFTKGTVTVREPLSELDVDLKVGKTTFGGGLRIRF